MSQIVDDPLALGRAALERHAWTEAYALLERAETGGQLSADGLAALAEAAFWTGHPDAAIAARERAYATYVASGEIESAAITALWLARDHVNRQAMAVAMGWVGRAERLLEDRRDSVAYGYLCLIRSFAAVNSGRLDDALISAREATTLGSARAERDLQAYGLMAQGMTLLAQGEVSAGLSLVDEATVAAVAGELTVMATGSIYCSTISACRDLADYRRASEWTEAATRWCERESINGFPGICRVHRADILRLRGFWAEAEREARRATDELARYGMTPVVAEGFCEIGEIRLRMGDLGAAAEAFRQAHEMGASPEPGLSALRLAQGDIAGAAMSIKRALADEAQPLRRARLLPTHVEIALAAGDLETARQAARELEAIASKAERPALRASARCANGAVDLAAGSLATASAHLRAGLRLWQEVDVPYEVARTRLLIAAACRAEGDEQGARLELEAARASFERLGARGDARIATQLLGAHGASAAGPQAERVTKTFLFTDIVQSTKLLEALGDDAWQELLRWHDHTLRSLIAEHEGEEIRHAGDGLVSSFRDSTKAIDCAIAIQRRLAEHRHAHGFALQLRIGVHAAVVNRQGLDYAGMGIHEAARIGALAGAGEILTSASTLTEARGRFRTSGQRAVSLKGVTDPVEVAAIEWR